MTKAELLAELRAARHGSSDLNEKIAGYLGWTSKKVVRRRWIEKEWQPPGVAHDDTCASLKTPAEGCRCFSHIISWLDSLPGWTHSLDAAKTLIPNGMLYRIWGGYGEGFGPAAAVYAPGAGTLREPINMHAGATDAIALCIAAIEATP